MSFDVAFLDSFRARFAEKEPAPRHLVRRVTKRDLYLSVRDIVDQHRAKGYAWEGIAEVFRELGVTISAATLRTCARRARAATKSVRRAPAPRLPPARTRPGSSPVAAHHGEPTPAPSSVPLLDGEEARESGDTVATMGGRKESDAAIGPPEPDAPDTARAAVETAPGRAQGEPATEIDRADAAAVAAVAVALRAGAASVEDVIQEKATDPAARRTTMTATAHPSPFPGQSGNQQGGPARASRPARRMAFDPHRDDEI